MNELNSFQSSFSSRSLQLQGSRRAWLEKKCSVILADNGRVEFEKLITQSILCASDLTPQCRAEQRALFILLVRFYLGIFYVSNR